MLLYNIACAILVFNFLYFYISTPFKKTIYKINSRIIIKMWISYDIIMSCMNTFPAPFAGWLDCNK